MGVWNYEQKRKQIVVTIDLFALVSKAVKEGIEAEAKHLSAFLGGDLHLVYK
jgi:hypothetical protein